MKKKVIIGIISVFIIILMVASFIIFFSTSKNNNESIISNNNSLKVNERSNIIENEVVELSNEIAEENSINEVLENKETNDTTENDDKSKEDKTNTVNTNSSKTTTSKNKTSSSSNKTTSKDKSKPTTSKKPDKTEEKEPEKDEPVIIERFEYKHNSSLENQIIAQIRKEIKNDEILSEFGCTVTNGSSGEGHGFTFRGLNAHEWTGLVSTGVNYVYVADEYYVHKDGSKEKTGMSLVYIY